MNKLFLILCLILLTAMAPGRPNASSQSPPVDKSVMKAPDFSLKTLSGRTVSLSSFKGKVVLLNFWATWCPPCRDEMPVFNRLYNEMRFRGLEIVAVSTDSSMQEIREFMGRKNFDYPIVIDEDRSVSKKYRVFSLPTTFLIDRNGVVAEKFYGEYEWTDPEIKTRIEKLLK